MWTSGSCKELSNQRVGSQLWSSGELTLGNCLEDSYGILLWGKEGSVRAGQFSSIISFKLRNALPWWARNQAEVSESLHGSTESSWKKLTIKMYRSGSSGKWHRRNIEILSKHGRLGLRKSKPKWSWICQKVWRSRRKVSMGMLAAEQTGKISVVAGASLWSREPGHKRERPR